MQESSASYSQTWEAAGYSVVGTRHRVNQDRYLVDSRRGLCIVADGMGGCRAGDRASHMAVDLLAYHPRLIVGEHSDRDAIRDAIGQAFVDVDQEIHATASLDGQLYGMGSTAVLVQRVGQRAFIASLGDSRAYLLRDGDLHAYTVDHNMAQTLVSLGVINREEARDHRWRHMLWKYLGVGKLTEGPDVSVVRLDAGDRLVLVTDGVTETLADRDLRMILDMHVTAEDAAEAVVRSAVSRGTRDDATCVVVNIGSSEFA